MSIKADVQQYKSLSCCRLAVSPSALLTLSGPPNAQTCSLLMLWQRLWKAPEVVSFD